MPVKYYKSIFLENLTIFRAQTTPLCAKKRGFSRNNLVVKKKMCNFALKFKKITFKKKQTNINQKKIIMSEIESKVVEIIVDKLGVDAAEVKSEASFTNDLGADSLDTVELIMELEKEFGVTIPDSDAEKIQTVGDAVAYIENASK